LHQRAKIPSYIAHFSGKPKHCCTDKAVSAARLVLVFGQAVGAAEVLVDGFPADAEFLGEHRLGFASGGPVP
jgi:hypothetical protein